MPVRPCMNNKPKISVVTCCYNQGSFIEENIQSVLAQKYPDFEHIVIDGGDDNTAEICEKHSHVKYVFQKPAGQCAALNLGFSKADGEIIAWLNADDYYTPNTFKRIVDFFYNAGEKTLICGKVDIVDAVGKLKWTLKNGRVPFFRLLAHPLLYRKEGRCAIPCQPTVFFKKELLKNIGMLRENLKYGMDYEFWLRALTNNYKFVYIPRTFACYRYHDSSLTNIGYDSFLPEWQSVSDEYYEKLSGGGKITAKLWNLYFVFESVLFRQHKKAEAILTKLRNADRNTISLPRQVGTVAGVVIRAPWLVFNILGHTFKLIHGRGTTNEHE